VSRRKVLWTAFGAIAALNAALFLQARAMTHYGAQRSRVASLFTGVSMIRPANTRTPADDGLSYETVRFPGGRGGPLEAWVVPVKDSRGVALLFHGYGEAKKSLLPTAELLRAYGYDAVLVDFTGSGGSGGSDTTLGWFEADEVRAAVDWAKTRWPGRKPLVVGISMGAAAVLRAVGSEGAQAEAVIIEMPFDRLLTSARRRFSKMGLPSFPLAELLVFWGGVQEGFNGFHHNPIEFAKGVHVPTLLLFGDADTFITLDDTQAILSNLAGPKSLAVFHGLQHVDYAKERPEEWKAAVGPFLAGLPAY
jgi:alpha-beta hydrolase superfamily lysophospholipase